jgi:MFS family permease
VSLTDGRVGANPFPVLVRAFRGALGAQASRRFLVATLIDWMGNGLLLASAPIFLLRVVHLRPTEIGLGMTLGAVVGLVLGIPLAALSDRWGTRRMLGVLYAIQALGFVAYAFVVRDLWTFVAVMSVLLAATGAAGPGLQTLVPRLESALEPIELLALMRTTINIGISVGGLAAAVALLAPTRLVFDLLLLGNAASFLVAGFLLRTLSVTAGTDGPRAPREAGIAWRARLRLPRPRPAVVLLSVTDGLLHQWRTVLNIALPLWIARATAAPLSTVGVLYLVNTVIAVLFQVSIGRMSSSLRSAARLELIAGSALAGTCLLIALGAVPTAAVPTIALLLVAVVLLSAGELTHAIAAWQISYAVTREERRNQDLAVYQAGSALIDLGGPFLVTVAVVGTGTPGWIGLAALFGLAGLAASRAVHSVAGTTALDPTPEVA